MTSVGIVTQAGVLIVRLGSESGVETHLAGKAPECLAVDRAEPNRWYAGTWGHGLWRSRDDGRSWEPAGDGLPHSKISAVAVAAAGGTAPAVVYAGTEPSTLSRSDDGGDSWQQLDSMLEVPSSSSWSFPPKPDTHHVRWIETDPHSSHRLYVAIEAGALLRSEDGGASWHDRAADGPIDTHTAAIHASARGRLYSAAGDGYFESSDGGQTWDRPMDGLEHRYLVGVAVDPGDPETVVVSAAAGPYVAYRPANAEAFVYRKTSGGMFAFAMEGLPPAAGTVASRLAAHPQEPGVCYAANNHGLFRSSDMGQHWTELAFAWPSGTLDRSVSALVVSSA
jgi:photosystem II stability/assembly factor-like uncharacterized protein